MKSQSINWMNKDFMPEEGYGRYGLHMIRALLKLGVEVTPLTTEKLSWPGWMQRTAGLDFSRLTILLMSVSEMKAVAGRVWGYSMYEDSSIPEGWAETVNASCERLLVPCQQNAEVFESRGVRVPIHVVHGGTSAEEFPLLPPIKRERPYTFLALADRGPRKGVETAWSAFFTAFADEAGVRLIVKTRANGLQGFGPLNFPDRRISFWREDVDSMADVYAQADCFVYPAYGDGWGMPPREAAMMGLPALVTRWSGLEVGIDHWAIALEKFHLQRSMMNTPDGEWAVPEV
ncbi:MAG: glycosyltransferase family 4 protein, partial [bacterium]|nr:glycosyltransferase family 4 protein [bacterium]